MSQGSFLVGQTMGSFWGKIAPCVIFTYALFFPIPSHLDLIPSATTLHRQTSHLQRFPLCANHSPTLCANPSHLGTIRVQSRTFTASACTNLYLSHHTPSQPPSRHPGGVHSPQVAPSIVRFPERQSRRYLLRHLTYIP